MKNILLIFSLILCTVLYGQNTYYIDDNGSDGNTGAIGSPWETPRYAADNMADGDTLYFREGDYGTVRLGVTDGGGVDTVFSSTTFFRGYPGETVDFDSLVLGSTACAFRQNGCSGDFDTKDGYSISVINIEFHRVDIAGGAYFHCQNATLDSCNIQIHSPYNGTEQAIDRGAAVLQYAKNCTVNNCDITNTGWGMYVSLSESLTLTNNTIHDIYQDGMVILTVDTILIEGNEIMRLYDGAGDGDGFDWNRHCDGIHLYPLVYNATSDYGIRNVTIRGNKIYHCESMLMMVNPKHAETYEFSNWIIEDNLFSGATGVALILNYMGVDGFIFRNNTMIDIPNDSFTRLEKTFNTTNTIIDFINPDISQGVECYNNLLGTGLNQAKSDQYDRYDHNSTYVSSGYYTTPGIGFVYLTSDPFVEITDRDGVLDPSSVLINAGTRLFNDFTERDDTERNDYYGVARDNRVDIGAYEYPGQSPAIEVIPDTEPETANTYKFDFGAPGITTINPFLYNDTTNVLNWLNTNSSYIVRFNSSFVSNSARPGFCSGGKFLTYSEEIFSEHTISLIARTSYNNIDGEGIIMMYQDDNNYYLYDIPSGRFVRRMAGVEIELSSPAGIKFSTSTTTSVEIIIDTTTTSIDFEILLDDSSEMTYSDNNSTAYNTFSVGGSMGFVRDNLQDCHSTVYDDIQVTTNVIMGEAPEIPPSVLSDTVTFNLTISPYLPVNTVNMTAQSTVYYNDTIEVYANPFTVNPNGTIPRSEYNDSAALTYGYTTGSASMDFVISNIHSDSIYYIEVLANRTGTETRNQYIICQNDTITIDVMDENNSIAVFDSVQPVADSISIKIVPISVEFGYLNAVKYIQMGTADEPEPPEPPEPSPVNTTYKAIISASGKAYVNNNGKIIGQ